MILLTLEEIKRHLRFPDTAPDSEEDPYLEDIEAAAIDYVSQYLNRAVPFVNCDGDPIDTPRAVRQGVLIAIADLYENRQTKFVGVSTSTLSTLTDLLHFHRVGLGI